jgi:predicted RecA/RadA family phage recombinase
MAKNYVQEGDVLPHTPVGPVASGALVLIGKRVGIALGDIAAGAAGSLMVRGVFKVPKLSTDVISQGEELYWDAANSRLTETPGANTLAGYAAEPAAAGVATVNISINA